MKPKIRIIHIFAPEIIKTDVENFRELVQRLTGKPTEKKQRGPRKTEQSVKKMELRTRFGSAVSSDPRQRIKGEEDIWAGSNSGGGFLGGFSDLDGFMQELSGFPMIPLDNSHMDYAYGTTQINGLA